MEFQDDSKTFQNWIRADRAEGTQRICKMGAEGGTAGRMPVRTVLVCETQVSFVTRGAEFQRVSRAYVELIPEGRAGHRRRGDRRHGPGDGRKRSWR